MSAHIFSSRFKTKICRIIAGVGNLNALQWAINPQSRTAESSSYSIIGVLKSHFSNPTAGCPWDAPTCSDAAAGSHLAVLQLTRSQGCPWDSGTCSNAAGGGHLEVLQWARRQGCPWMLGHALEPLMEVI